MPPFYCHGCPVTVVPSQLYCPIYSVPSVMFRLPCSGHSVLSFLPCLIPIVLSSFPAQALVSQLYCLSILVPSSFAPLSCLFYVLIVLSYLFCPTCPILDVLSWKYTDCPVLATQGCPHMAAQKLKIKETNDIKKIPFPETCWKVQ
jgi:hypothetical protein